MRESRYYEGPANSCTSSENSSKVSLFSSRSSDKVSELTEEIRGCDLAHHSIKFPDEFSHKDVEKLCNVFASAVLFPEEMARKELHQERFHFYERELVLLKERWGISISAIFQRAHHLGIINDYVLRKFNIGYRSRGHHRNEPGDFHSQEHPNRFARLVYFALGKDIISINEAAYYSGMSLWDFRKSNYQLV